MRSSFFIARRLVWGSHRQVSRLGAVLGIVGVALAITVMQVALSIVGGFESEVTRKLVGLAGDVQVGAYLPLANEETRPLPRTPAYLPELKSVLPTLEAIYPYARKAALLQAGEELDGIQLKGIPPTWDARYLPGGITAGRLPNYTSDSTSREIVISKNLANLLLIEVGDKARLFFLDKNVRARPATIVGLYDTGLEEYDQAIVFCDLRLIQQLYGWPPDSVEGLEIHLAGPLPEAAMQGKIEALNDLLPPEHEAHSVYELYPDLFSWLNLQHQNVRFILVLMIVVAIINLASALLIRITEQTGTIGLFKSLGATPGQLRGIFLWDAGIMLGIGALVGNALSFTLLALQDAFGLFKLSEGAYFVREVPVGWDWAAFAFVNLGVAAVCLLSMLLPTLAISRIRPAKALQLG